MICDTTKNSYLGDSFGFSENTTIANYSRNTSIVPTDDVTDNFKRPLPIEGSSYSEIHTDREKLHELEQIKEPKNALEKSSLLEKQNNMVNLNHVENFDEISTVADLVNTFCDEELQSENVTLDFQKSKVEHKRKVEDSIEEIRTKTNEANQIENLSRLAIVDIEISSSDSSHLLSQPQAKKVCVEKSSKLEPFKRFTFHRSKRTNNAPAVNDNGSYNQESYTNEKDNIGKMLPNFNLNDNSKSKIETEIERDSAISSKNLVSRSSTENTEVCKPGPSVATKQIQQDNDSANIATSNNIGNIKSHIEPKNGSFNKFAFKSRPPKKVQKTEQPNKPEARPSSQSVSDTSKISSQRNVKSTQSSQSVFKRIFPKFVGKIDAEDLDDPLFKI